MTDTTPRCCYVIPMYNERILIHAILRQVNLSSLHSLLPFNQMYAGLNSIYLLMFILALHTSGNLICCVSFNLLHISFPLLVFCLTQGCSCCVPFLEELEHCVIAWPAEAISVIQSEIFYLRSSKSFRKRLTNFRPSVTWIISEIQFIIQTNKCTTYIMIIFYIS